MADNKNDKPERPRITKPEETIWVICASPVTLLLPTEERRLAAGESPVPNTARVYAPLKLERGVNVLAGPVVQSDGKTKWITVDGLPPALQQQPEEERGYAALDLFGRAKELYPQMFKAFGAVPPRIAAVGTLAQIVRDNYAALLTGATLGTHRGSLEALVSFPGATVQDHIKDLARARLTAWRPAA